jgi:AcrR family transcriptional regulator
MATSAGQAKRNEVLDVATQLFAKKGYDGASMQDVAERAGLGKASLFYHFATKDLLYEAVLDRLVRSLAEPLAAIYASGGSFADRLDALTTTINAALGARPYAARLLLRETMNPVDGGSFAPRVLVVLEAGAAWVRAGQDAGAFCDGDTRHLVLSILGMHILPFAIDSLVEGYIGADPFTPAFLVPRAAELRRQARRLHLVPDASESARDAASSPKRGARRARR